MTISIIGLILALLAIFIGILRSRKQSQKPDIIDLREAIDAAHLFMGYGDSELEKIEEFVSEKSTALKRLPQKFFNETRWFFNTYRKLMNDRKSFRKSGISYVKNRSSISASLCIEGNDLLKQLDDQIQNDHWYKMQYTLISRHPNIEIGIFRLKKELRKLSTVVVSLHPEIKSQLLVYPPTAYDKQDDEGKLFKNLPSIDLKFKK